MDRRAVFASQESLDLAAPQSQDASHLLPPPLPSSGGVSTHRGSSDRQDGRSPAEEDGLQVNYHVNQGSTGGPAHRGSFDLASTPLFHSFSTFLLPPPSLSLSVFKEVCVSRRRSGCRQACAAYRTSATGGGDTSTRACPEAPGTKMLLSGS